jgi:hypothetical protein
MAPDNLLRAAEILAVDPMVLQFGEDGARREYGKRAAGSGIGVSEPAANRARQTRDVPIIGLRSRRRTWMASSTTRVTRSDTGRATSPGQPEIRTRTP